MTEPASEPLTYIHRDLMLDRLKRKVTVAGTPLDLTAREFALLELLLAHSGQVLTRERITSAVWETSAPPDTNLIDVYVLRLRKKLTAAVPEPPNENPEQYAPQINRIARITSYAGSNFNNGLRAYYFALAALAWFLHPWLMIAATLWVMLVLYQREFGSKTLKAMVEEDRSPALDP